MLKNIINVSASGIRRDVEVIILGIDTAIRCTGYGIVNINIGNKISVIDCGVIKNPQKILHSECLRRISGGIRELILKFTPDSAAIEGAFVNKNIKTAMILSYARGAAMATLAEHAVPIYAYSPRKAKLAVTGNGNSTKEQVALVLASVMGLKLEEIPLDSTDALALALCHGHIVTRPGAVHFLPARQ